MSEQLDELTEARERLQALRADLPVVEKQARAREGEVVEAVGDVVELAARRAKLGAAYEALDRARAAASQAAEVATGLEVRRARVIVEQLSPRRDALAFAASEGDERAAKELGGVEAELGEAQAVLDRSEAVSRGRLQREEGEGEVEAEQRRLAAARLAEALLARRLQLAERIDGKAARAGRELAEAVPEYLRLAGEHVLALRAAGADELLVRLAGRGPRVVSAAIRTGLAPLEAVRGMAMDFNVPRGSLRHGLTEIDRTLAPRAPAPEARVAGKAD